MKFTEHEIRKAMRLYAVTDSSWLREGETLTEVVREVLKHGATFLQLREKNVEQDTLEKQARELKTLCEAYRVPFVVNDSVEVAMRCNADGVHVGQSDIQGRDIRQMIGPDKILGISAATVEEAVAAEKAGANYIGVGAVFDTSTKKHARTMSLERLRAITKGVKIPVVAIGGIHKGNIGQLCGSGVDGVAVVSAIFAAQDPGKATAQLLALSHTMVDSHG